MDDERYYQIVADELRDNRINDALWTKAIAKSQGDEGKTKATYINLRIEQIMLQEKRARSSGSSASEATEDDSAGEAAADSTEAAAKRKAALIAQIIIFVVGVFIIWKFLFPWIRELKSRMAG